MRWQSIRTIIVSIVLITALTAGGIGCYQGTEQDTSVGDSRPFYSDRVVAVCITMPEENWEFLQHNTIAEQYVKADLWYDGECISDIAVRPKGNSSLRSAVRTGSSRFGLKVDLNFFNSARNLYGVKKLNFNNGFSDPTLIREVLGYELFKQMGIPTPRTSFVDLRVNDTHLGLYTMIEQIDTTFLSNNFVDATGNLYKPQMPAAYLSWTKEDLEQEQTQEEVTASTDRTGAVEVNLGGGNLKEIMRSLESREIGSQDETLSDVPRGMMPSPGMGPWPDMGPPGMPGRYGSDLLEQMALKTNENKPNHTLLLRFLDVLNNEPDETFPSEIEKVLDVDEVLRYLAVSTLIVHLDNYIAMGHNYYLYDNNGKFVIIPWDLNMAFGTFNFGLDREQLINYYIDEPTGGPFAERPLVKRLLSCQPYLDAYHRHLEKLLDGPFAVDRMNSRIDELAALIRPYVRTDKLKFYSTEDFETALEEDITRTMVRMSNPIGLKSFVEERRESVINQLAGMRKSGPGDGSGNGGSFRMGGRMDW